MTVANHQKAYESQDFRESVTIKKTKFELLKDAELARESSNTNKRYTDNYAGTRLSFWV